MGKKGGLPWYIPEDLRKFKTLTTGHPIIMGRKTFESIGRPLPNRTNIVITRDSTFHQEGIVVVSSLEMAIHKAQEVESKELFIIGGGEIFRQSIDFADKLYITLVHEEIDGDIIFPEYSAFNKLISKSESSGNGFTYAFVELSK
jgi:dihydrofolate reductase